MNRASTAATEAGFTLVELLVAMALLGLLTTALYAGLSFGITAWRRAADAGATLSRIGAAEIALRDILTRAYPLILRPSGQDARIDFEGDSAHVTLLAPAPAEIAPGGFAHFTIQFERVGDTLVLASYAQPELAKTTRPVRHVLLGNVKQGSFAYYGAGRDKATPQWLSVWNGRLRLPLLIQLRLSFAGSHAPEWPGVVIHPRVEADATCSFDPVSKSCRGI